MSFKAGTDDLRNSPSVAVIEYFLGKGYKILIYDNNVQLSRLTGKNRAYIDRHLPYLSNLLVENVEDLLEISEIIIINKEDIFTTLLNEVSDKIIIDLVRLNENLLFKSNYHGINW